MSLSSYQQKIIFSTTDMVRVNAKLDQIGYKIVADFPITKADHNGMRKGFRVAFEDDAVVYIYVGDFSVRGFYSNGMEITLCNAPDDVVLATIKALAAV